ncbi:hypothetical protein HK105_208259 [Polyrhizophydium stewartii]|uniref:Ankyrin repeat protein n=1 Tax=Polyrhizophydium stewartii TaxID=2732419 RepID=A0ABR4MY95_9FUNG
MSSDTTRAGGRDGDGSGGAAHALPHGASHWDRIPRELHDGILDAAGPLTRLTASNPHPAEVRCMSRQDRERLWTDVVEVDWQGDLAILPPVPLQSVLLGVRSRSLLQRLFEQRIVFKETHQRIAIRNGWHDLLNVNDAFELGCAAATEGDLELLKRVLDDGKELRNYSQFAHRALVHGHLDIAKYLHNKQPSSICSEEFPDEVASSGNLDCLIWIHDMLRIPFGRYLAGYACEGGHIHAVKFLIDQPGMRIGSAIYMAARFGQIQILDFLLERFPEEFAPLAAKQHFVEISDLTVLKWLHTNNIDFDHDFALQSSVDEGQARLGALAVQHF